tara:strand:- start:4926 stop:6098 length:1173 start_codon:yes stop_codon:yes gene_type:complete
MKLSTRVQTIKPSPTLAITARAAQLKASGKDIIGLGAGEPDFDTPHHIKEAAIEAINNGKTKYTPVDGTNELKEAVLKKFERENNLSYNLDQVLVSVGAKQSFYNLAQALLNPGDEVVIITPYWVSYPDMVLLAGGKPVFINTSGEQNFKVTSVQLRTAITDKTRMVVINSPSNPSGIAYSHKELASLGEVLRDYPKITIATDDIYEHILWESNTFVNIVNVCPDLIDRAVVLNGVSKAYSMTGWRIGYTAGPESLIKAMKKIQSQSTSNPTSISQAAAVAALNGPQDCITDMLGHFKDRHDFMVTELNKISGIECMPTDGTFYVFPKVEGLVDAIDGVANDLDLAEYLIKEAGVAIVPGSAFGSANYARLSIATKMENLKEALSRLKSL